jgi:hypothetical protein
VAALGVGELPGPLGGDAGQEAVSDGEGSQVVAAHPAPFPLL